MAVDWAASERAEYIVAMHGVAPEQASEVLDDPNVVVFRRKRLEIERQRPPLLRGSRVNMAISKKTRDLIAEEAAAAEAGEADQDTPVPSDIKITRGHPRSKVLQVRLNSEELDALERIATRRALPVSTIAREELLRFINEESALDPAAQIAAAADRIRSLVSRVRTQV
ncbi:hypothetical protein [Mycobacterium sp.]|uniref:hypothetical protein n=1 Tax=Mycobacterium sp. TaxID=1785 RepID=UPI003D6BD3D8